MTQLMEIAIERLKRIPEAEQDEVASRIIDELEDDELWDEKFSRSQSVLDRLANKAKADIQAGRVRSIGIDEL